jgi:nucleoid DNA-binding protein
MKRGARKGAGEKQSKPQATPRSATKPVVIQKMADVTHLPKKAIANVFAALIDLVKHDLGQRGPGVFILPGLVKLKRREWKAIGPRTAINPMTGERITVLGKPARIGVRAVPLKALVEQIQ